MPASLRIEALGSQHDRGGFTCGVEALDRYFQDFATQDIKRRVSNCFVGIAAENAIAGFYTFAATGVPLGDLPPEVTRKLPRYPLVPAALIGRLAVATSHRGKGIGAALVTDAALRAARSDPAIFALIVDAKDETAACFYEHLGFRRFASREGTLYLPLATAMKAFSAL